jgi:YD repeat-containing protein
MKAALLCIALIGLCYFTAAAQSPSQTPSPQPSPASYAGEKAAEKSGVNNPSAPTAPVKTGKAALSLPPEKSAPVKPTLFAKPPTIDGKLDDEVWQTAVVLKDFYQVQPGDNLVPQNRTEVRLGYDERFLYIAFHCFDDPSKVRANIPKRDNIWDDDYVGILFDTFNDQRRAYEFDFNPLGVQADGIWTEGQGEDFSLDLVMESKGMVTSDGYTIEVAIPFKSLRYVAGKDKLWGVHFWRRTKRLNNSLDMWIPMDRDKNSWLAQAGHLTGLEGLSTERTLELIPSLTVSETGKRKSALPFSAARGTPDPGRFVNEPIKLDPGLTGKYTLTPTVTLDFTLNPDFAQVESDQLVVTANQRFPIFFEEKRPFFLEGIDIFNTQIAAVHTRAIIDPDYAVKLTGKLNRNTFGLLLASDNGPGNFNEEDRTNPNVFPGIQRFVDKNASVGIMRLKRDVGKSDSFVGFLTTYYHFVDRYNELGGFDGRFRIDKQTTFSWQVLGTHSRDLFFFPEEGKRRDSKQNGFIYALDYNQSGRHFGHEFAMVGRTRYYIADVGFNRRPNTNNPNWFIRYNSEPKPKAKLISWRVYTDLNANFDWQGRSQNFNDETQIQLQLPKQTYFGLGVDKGYDRVFESEFGPKRQPGSNCVANNTCTFAGDDNERSSPTTGAYFFGGSSPSKKYNFNFFVNHVWGALDFDFGAGPKFPRVSPPALAASQARDAGLCNDDPLPAGCRAPQDPGPGDFWHFDGGITYQPTSAINARLSYTKERLTRYDTGRVAFDENIVSLRTTYQFTRFIFARGRVDYDTLASNVKGQFLLGWTPNPGTAFYAGYNDDLNRNGFSPFSGQLEPGFRRNGRTFFIKMSYLFRRSF